MNYGTACNQMHSFVSLSRKNSLSNGDVLGSPYSSNGNNFGNGTSPNLQQLSPLPSPRYASSPLFNLQPKTRSNSLNSKQGSISYNRSSNMRRCTTSDKSWENTSNLSRSPYSGYGKNMRSSTSPKFSRHYTSPPSFNHQPKAGFNTQTSEQSSMNYNRSSNLSWSSTSNTSYDNTASDSSFSTSFNYSGNRGKHFQRNSSASKGNPAHSSDIRLYVDPSMLEDPWKELMQKLEEEKLL